MKTFPTISTAHRSQSLRLPVFAFAGRGRMSMSAGQEKAWVLADQALVSGVSFLTMILLARQLGALQFGWFASVLLCQLFILAVQNALIMGPCQVLQADYTGQDKKAYLDSLFMLQVGLVAAFILAVWLLFYWPASSFPLLQPLRVARFWILLALGGFLLQDFLRRVLLVGEKARMAFWIDAVTNVLQLAGLLYLFARNELRFTNAFMVIGLTYIPSILLGYYWLDIRIPPAAQWRLTLRGHAVHGKWLLMTALLQWWAGNAFIVAAGFMLGVAAFGALRLAQNIFGVFNVLLQAFENYALPQSARLYKDSGKRFKAYLVGISYKSALFFVPVLAGLALFSRTILRIAGGESYTGYHGVIPWLCILYFFIFLGYPIRIYIRVLSLNRAFFIGYGVAALFSLLAAHRFIEWWGVYGVVLGLIINQVLILLYWLLVLQQKRRR